MPNFANSAATVRTTSMAHIAQQVARTGSRSDVLTTDQGVPPQIVNAMSLQGMANMNAWGPGQPINPNEPIGSEPRQFEYMIGQNIVQRPRSTENIGFDTLRQLIEMYDVAQMAIEVRQDELRNLEWDIVPYDEDETDKYASEIKAVRQFFEKPDGHMLFDDFQNQLAYDWLAFDALSIYPRLTKGGKLGALEPIDGTSITPMIDYYGRLPEAPAPAYVQWINGMPWVWLDRNQLLYVPHRRRTNKLYGYPPMEWLLNNVNTDIRYQIYFLQYFTEGSVPDTWANAPEGMNAAQIKEFQMMYDAVMAGDQAQKHKVRFLPSGTKPTPAKDLKFDTPSAQYFLTKSCAAFKVTPAELGFTEKVNKSSGETQENVQYRRSIKPSAKYFSSIYTGIIHKYFGLPNLYFKFLNLDEQEDMLVMAQRDELYIKAGVISPDEVRVERLGYEVDAENPVPRGFLTNTGFIPVDVALKQSAASIDQINAQTDANRAKAGEPPLDPGQEQGVVTDPGVTENIRQQSEAEKAALDFFVRPARSTRTGKSRNG